MIDVLNLDEVNQAILMPEQRLMVAIIQRAVDDWPLSRGFFQAENGMFRFCCEALGMNHHDVKANIDRRSSEIQFPMIVSKIRQDTAMHLITEGKQV